jgi:hypothetical protein
MNKILKFTAVAAAAISLAGCAEMGRLESQTSTLKGGQKVTSSLSKPTAKWGCTYIDHYGQTWGSLKKGHPIYNLNVWGYAYKQLAKKAVAYINTHPGKLVPNYLYMDIPAQHKTGIGPVTFDHDNGKMAVANFYQCKHIDVTYVRPKSETVGFL